MLNSINLLKSTKIREIVILFLAIAFIFMFLGRIWPIGPDYYYTFRPVTEKFFSGDTRLYDGTSHSYFLLPWGILIFAPTILFPLTYGQLLISIFSILGIVLCIKFIFDEVRIPFGYLALAILNLHTFDLIIRGNMDGVLALGLGLGWLGVQNRKPIVGGLGILIIFIKPINVILPLLVLLKMIKNWAVRDQLMIFLPLVIAIFFSFLISGFDWPIRYLLSLNEYPPMTYLQTSSWRIFEFFGYEKVFGTTLSLSLMILSAIILIFSKPDRNLFLLALAMNLTFSIYTLGSHYVLLVPIFLYLMLKSKFFIFIWLFTLTPLLRLFWGFSISWIDIVYPFSLLISLLGVLFHNFRQSQYILEAKS